MRNGAPPNIIRAISVTEVLHIAGRCAESEERLNVALIVVTVKVNRVVL